MNPDVQASIEAEMANKAEAKATGGNPASSSSSSSGVDDGLAQLTAMANPSQSSDSPSNSNTQKSNRQTSATSKSSKSNQSKSASSDVTNDESHSHMNSALDDMSFDSMASEVSASNAKASQNSNSDISDLNQIMSTNHSTAKSSVSSSKDSKSSKSSDSSSSVNEQAEIKKAQASQVKQLEQEATVDSNSSSSNQSVASSTSSSATLQDKYNQVHTHLTSINSEQAKETHQLKVLKDKINSQSVSSAQLAKSRALDKQTSNPSIYSSVSSMANSYNKQMLTAKHNLKRLYPNTTSLTTKQRKHKKYSQSLFNQFIWKQRESSEANDDTANDIFERHQKEVSSAEKEEHKAIPDFSNSSEMVNWYFKRNGLHPDIVVNRENKIKASFKNDVNEFAKEVFGKDLNKLKSKPSSSSKSKKKKKSNK